MILSETEEGVKPGFHPLFCLFMGFAQLRLCVLGEYMNVNGYCKRFVVCVVLGVVACAQDAAYQRPDLPVPKVWPIESSGVTRKPLETGWRTFFIDPDLQSLIASALEYNRDLRIAAARVQEARAQFGIVRADRVPSVNLVGVANSSGTVSALMGTDSSSLSISAVSFELDFWGRLAGLSDAARLSYLATEEAQSAVRLSLIADVASAYFTLLQLNELTALAYSTVDLRSQSLALITKGRDLGGTFELEVQQSFAMLETSRATLASIEHQRTVAVNRLRFLVGHAPAEISIEKTLKHSGMDGELTAGLPAEVLLARPDVMAAEQRLVAAHANVGAARAAFFPKVLLTAGLSGASQGLTSLFQGGAWVFQPTISMPLFDGGRAAAGVDIAKARGVIAVAEYEKAIQLAFREVADLLSERVSLAIQLRSSVANAGAQEKRLEIAQARHDVGLVSYLEVLDGQRELVAAQQGVIQVRRAQLESAAQLFKALGGGRSDG